MPTDAQALGDYLAAVVEKQIGDRQSVRVSFRAIRVAGFGFWLDEITVEDTSVPPEAPDAI